MCGFVDTIGGFRLAFACVHQEYNNNIHRFCLFMALEKWNENIKQGRWNIHYWERFGIDDTKIKQYMNRSGIVESHDVPR